MLYPPDLSTPFSLCYNFCKQNVSEIALALKNWDNALVAGQLKKKRREIEAAIEREREKLARIDTALSDLNKKKPSIRYNIVIKSIPGYQVLSLRRIIPDYFCEEILWKELSEFVRSEDLDIPQNSFCFAIYHDAEYKESDVDVEVCVEVGRAGENKNGFVYRTTEGVDTMACAMVYGPFENIAGGYAAFAHWLIQHSLYKITGQDRQICHRGPWNEEDPEKYLIEIQIPVKRI